MPKTVNFTTLTALKTVEAFTFILMQNNDPIIIVEDDLDDFEMIQTVLNELEIENEQIWFKNGLEALEFLATTNRLTSLILSDINMPRMNGIELKKAINSNENLRKKSIPFVFLTTSTSRKDIDAAYELLVQGFFAKPSTVGSMRDIMKMIVTYWSTCAHPSKIR